MATTHLSFYCPSATIVHSTLWFRLCRVREVIERLKILTQIDGLEVVIGGGLTKGNISRVLLHRPKILIVGRAISSASDITLATKDIKDLITNVATRGEKR